MSILKDNLIKILEDKNTNLLPENLKKGINCLGIEGAYELTIDENLKPENIRLGITISGIKGTYYGDEIDGLVVKEDGYLHLNDDLLNEIEIASDYICGTVNDWYYDGYAVIIDITYTSKKDRGIVPFKFSNLDYDIGTQDLDTSITEPTNKKICLENCKITDMLHSYLRVSVNEEEITHELSEYDFEVYMDNTKVDNSKFIINEEDYSVIISETSFTHTFNVSFENYSLEDENGQNYLPYIELLLSNGNVVKGDYDYEHWAVSITTELPENVQVTTIRVKFDKDVIYRKNISFTTKFDESTTGELDLIYNTKTQSDIESSIWTTGYSDLGDIIVFKDIENNPIGSPFVEFSLSHFIQSLTVEQIKSIETVDYYMWDTVEELAQLPIQDYATWDEENQQWTKTITKENMFTCKMTLGASNMNNLRVDFNEAFELIEGESLFCTLLEFDTSTYTESIDSYSTDENGMRYIDGFYENNFIWACLFATDINFSNTF